jgi:hypothetical protein
MEEMKIAYQILIGESDEESPHLQDPGMLWGYVQIYFKEISLEGEDLIHLAWDKDHWWSLENMAVNRWIP